MNNIVPLGPVRPNLVRFQDQRGHQVNAALTDDVAKHLITCATVVGCVCGIVWIATRKQ